MREVQHIVEEVTFSNDSFALSLAYINWETDAIVGIELIRNIGIALGTFGAKIFVAIGKIFAVLYSSLYLRDDAGDAGQLARVAAGDDVRAADHAGRGGLHALVGAHHRHHEHERSHHQRRTLCGLLRTHRAWLPHRARIQRFVLS